MKVLKYGVVVASAAALWALVSAGGPAPATSPERTAGAEAASPGWGLVYAMDPATGSAEVVGFAAPNGGQPIPLPLWQHGFVADPRTGLMTPMGPGNPFATLPATRHTGGLLPAPRVSGELLPLVP
ncbi:hypothetical protein SLA_3457 [Streptomyces laurentii]|uniref:Uncharacterized protein n=1 Tax=Streptomyces laurentii TaxID=39478 RepID=A0A160P151_STRLU|nr:hypothetical protein SLA_3457 [Streptomyces laurentii]